MKKVLLRLSPLWGLLFMSFIFYNSALAQESFYKNFTVRDGLPSMTIYRGFQGKDGRIWLATENGLSAFDGFEFQNWHLESGLPDSEVTELAEDSEGRIWFCCPNGHLGFMEDDSIFSSANTDWIPRFKNVPTILGLLKDGRMAAGDPSLILYISPNRVDTAFSGRGSASRFVLDLDEDGVWVIGADGKPICSTKTDSVSAPHELVKNLPVNWSLYRSPGKVRCIDRSELEQLSKHSTALEASIFNSDPDAPLIDHFCIPSSGELWVGSFSSGLWQLKADQVETRRILQGASVGGIFFDQSGNQWVTSMGQGLFLIPRAASAVQNYAQYTGLANPEAHCLAVTPGSKLLVGHDDLKLSVAGSDIPLKFAPYLTPGRARIRDLEFLDSGHLLVATDQNMMVLPPNFADHNHAHHSSLINPTGKYPLEGSTRLHKGNPYVMPKQVAMKDLEVIDSNTWVGATAGGIIRFSMEKDVVHFKYITHNRCWALGFSPEQDRLWVAGQETLFTYEDDSLVVHPMSADLHTRILSLASDGKGGLWVSTSGQGLFRVEGDQWKQYGTGQGMPSLNCTALAIESPSKIWVGTDVGVAGFNYDPSSPEELVQMNTIGYEQGLLNQYINDLALTHDALLVASPEGVSVFDKAKLGQETAPPCLEFSKVLIHGKDTLQQDRYDLPHNLNSLTFHLWDPCFTANQFRYRIPEKDSQWVVLPGNIADFPYLGEGAQYHLEFQSVNPQGLVSPIKPVFVSVAMPFFRSSWFLLSICALSFGGLLVYLEMRTRNSIREREHNQAYLQRLSQMRFSALKSQMNPHFLFNSLHSIQELILSEDGETTHIYISRFAMLMRRILDHSIEDFVNISQELEVTQLYLDLEFLRHQKGIEMQVVKDDQLDMENLWMPALILQPFIENAIWHGLLPKEGERNLTIQVKGLKNEVLFSIEDNGIGRAAAALHQSTHPGSASLSTENFSERMHILNRAFGEWAFSYRYQDLMGKNGNPAGTRLEIRIPYLNHPPQPYRVG